ncbi:MULTISPECIES: response regulator transcription factor [unclassified Paenibacillus]|uniref:response regulator transcription factor n=1 Tax=unclassified Paenibacillus TaxID=185978 RepID=UPI000CFC22F1|nr:MULTISPECIES: response regulator transcription factor [unclassified Paenibacillus]MBD8837661.1 response regulator transcription factor [Paenibacillus sp. CFBP 13594]PRA07122.1 DNA-binding response regulator [Paenibacillus sp. MYb63]PRA50768.1 DNA-binding response regulator [Paenibacillus sp. MYb67]QZN73903.1 response regulator transcription factor [Paenibacillus sp. DR312]
MQNIRVLIADDDKEIRDLIRKYLEREMYTVDTAADGEQALQLFQQHKYNMVILDLMMPQMDGMEACRRIRSISNVPIMMVTAKDHETDKIIGLGIGADDYITKPFSIHELVARIKALMRRFMVLGTEVPDHSEVIRFKGLMMNLKTYTVDVQGKETDLTGKETELLKFMMSNPGQVFTKAQLFRNVWDNGYLDDDNTIMVHIRKLRMKIESDPSNPQFIKTVWGIGYKFVGERDE